MAELIPPKKELQLISSYTEKHPGSTLDAPEQLVLQLSEIKEKAHLLLHKSQFLERLASVQTNLSMLHDASNSLHHNEELCKVLGIILYIGNKLNAGNPRRGNAKGFELDILGKLRDVRTRDGTSNLLQYIVRCYASTMDKVMKNEFPLPCPIKLTAGSQVSFEDLKTDMEFLQSQVKASEEMQKQISTLPHEKSAVFLRHAHANLRKSRALC